MMPEWLCFLQQNYPDFIGQVIYALHQNKVPLLAGTDVLGVPVLTPGSSLHTELALLTKCGLSPMDALKTATIEPAVFIDKELEIGSIAVGKQADFLLLNSNPLDNIENLKHISGVMVRGIWLLKSELDENLKKMLPY
jgi:imidazolonepropionase-like amidohydrolase